MILELADIQIISGKQAEFEQAAAKGLATVVAHSEGFLGCELKHSIESPDRYVLLIKWRTLEDHTVKFRGSPAYPQWRAHISDYLAGPPNVEHFETVGSAVI
ncbi:MAG: antibiotic biosynthesis monooxygenase [Burkholderiaceae bacterium]